MSLDCSSLIAVFLINIREGNMKNNYMSWVFVIENLWGPWREYTLWTNLAFTLFSYIYMYMNNHKCITIADDVATVGKRIVFFLLLGTQSRTTCRYRVRCVYTYMHIRVAQHRSACDAHPISRRLHRMRPPMYLGTSHRRLCMMCHATSDGR